MSLLLLTYAHVVTLVMLSTPVAGMQKPKNYGPRLNGLSIGTNESREANGSQYINTKNGTSLAQVGTRMSHHQKRSNSSFWDLVTNILEPEATGKLYNVRVCNAYTAKKSLDMVRVRANVSKIFGTGGLLYKMCHDFPIAAQANDTFSFEVGSTMVGNFTVPETIDDDAPSVIMLVAHRTSRSHHNKLAQIEVRTFGNMSHRELMVVDAVPRSLKRHSGRVTLLETRSRKSRTTGKLNGTRNHRKERRHHRAGNVTNVMQQGFGRRHTRRLHKKRYEVMASSRVNGTLSVTVDASRPKNSFSSTFEHKYVVMRVGTGEHGYPEELVSFPSSTLCRHMHILVSVLIGLLMALV